MDEAETATLFNDLCVLAPGALIDRGTQWREIDAHTVSASFTNASDTLELLAWDVANLRQDVSTHFSASHR